MLLLVSFMLQAVYFYRPTGCLFMLYALHCLLVLGRTGASFSEEEGAILLQCSNGNGIILAEILDATMKKLALQLLFSPAVLAFYSSRQVCRPITTQVRKNKNEGGESCCSLAYSFRDPDEDSSAYWEESKKKSTSLRSSSSSANGSSDSSSEATSNNIGGAAVLLDENEIDIVGSGTLGDIMSGPAAPDTKQTLNSSPSSPSSSTTNVNNKKVIDGLVTKEGGELNTRFNCNFSPMERIALTSNGNLQRIFSSYYDAPVHVHIDFCSRRTEDETTATAASATVPPTDGTRRKTSVMDYYTSNTYNNFDIIDKNNKYSPKEDMGKDKNCCSSSSSAIWDRIVHIHIHGQTICRATSIISVKDPTCIRLIENGTMGIGQLFRYLDRLPTFSLVDAGRTTPVAAAAVGGKEESTLMEAATVGTSCNDSISSGTNDVSSFFEGGIWRTYELKCDEMTCLIHEEFHKDAWNISPEGTSSGGTGAISPFKPMI